jgi:hypothetical protein
MAPIGGTQTGKTQTKKPRCRSSSNRSLYQSPMPGRSQNGPPNSKGVTCGDHSYTVLNGCPGPIIKTLNGEVERKSSPDIKTPSCEAGDGSDSKLADDRRRHEHRSASDWPSGSGDGRSQAGLTAKVYKTRNLERDGSDRLQLSERQQLSTGDLENF